MIIVVKLLLLTMLSCIAYQDIKDRNVYAVAFILFAATGGYLHYHNTIPELFLITTAMNLMFVFILMLMITLYVKIKLRQNLKDALGLGDILFFVAVALSFATITFIITFVFALIGALLLHLTIKSNKHNKTIPLAGYMSIFYTVVFVGYWLGIINTVYTF